MNQPPTLSESLVKALVNFPRHILAYVVGLVVATLDDYTLITLTILSVLLGFALSSVFYGVLAYFAGYFIVRLVNVFNEVLGFGARNVAAAIANSNPQPPIVTMNPPTTPSANE